MTEQSVTAVELQQVTAAQNETEACPESSPSVSPIQEVNKPEENLQTHDMEESVTVAAETVDENRDQEAEDGTKRVKRNVSFPPDSLVMGYLDPPDPWKNVGSWSPGDLVKAYKRGCEKHGAKPLNKVVQQLQGMENVGERYEILSLKGRTSKHKATINKNLSRGTGERLDMKQCESLEDVFKLVRFRCLDLEATHLDDETAVAIFDMVEYYETACKLNISFNKSIGPRGWQSCSKLVRKTPCLTFIDARNCDLNERVMPILGRSLRMGCYLTRLQLQSTGLACKSLMILVAALKMNETLKELFIGDNKLMPTDGVQIGNLLKYNHKLELLDLRNNHLQDVGTSHICDGLFEQTTGSGLATLVLWSNQISFQAMSAVSKALMSTESLETLNLGHNNITNEGVHLLKDGLLKSKSLLKLGLSGTKISCEGAVALAEVIADNPRLVRLDLQENDIKTAGLMALSLALKVNESLTRLDIDKEMKKESGVKDYAEQQKRLKEDVNRYLERNREDAYKRNQAKRQLEQKNEENLKKQAQQDLEPASEEALYIPSEDTISRPKLLFCPHPSPESELDSPVALARDLHFTSPVLATPSSLGAFPAQSPHGPDLLSPQYCPKITAKKLFSVKRVESPILTSPIMETREMMPQICAPLPQLAAPSASGSSLDQDFDAISQEVIDPNLMKKSLEAETLESYIQQIVDADNFTVLHGLKDDRECPDLQASCDDGQQNATDAFSGTSDLPNDSVTVSHALTSTDSDVKASTTSSEHPALSQSSECSVTLVTPVTGDSTVMGSDAVIAPDGKTREQEDSCGSELTLESDGNEPLTRTLESQTGQSPCSNVPGEVSVNANNSIPGDASETDERLETEVSETSQADPGQQESVDIPTDLETPGALPTSCGQRSLPASSGEGEGKGWGTPVLSDRESPLLNATVRDNPLCEPVDSTLCTSMSTAPKGTDLEKQDPGLHSIGDQWNKVDGSDITEKLDFGGKLENPNFYTSLSMNGLKQELASLIDGEDSSQSITVASSPVLEHTLHNGAGQDVLQPVMDLTDS